MKVVSYVARRHSEELAMDQYWSRAIDYIWQADCFQSPELLAEVVYQMSGCFLKQDCVYSSRVWNSGHLCASY